MKVRKKPITVNAIQFDGKNSTAVEAWGVGLHGKIPFGVINAGQKLVIPTLEGEMIADAGDWIICGIKGEFYPCKPDVFFDSYEILE